MHVRLLRRTLASALGGSLLLTAPAIAGAQPPAPRQGANADKVCPMDVPRTQVLERGFDGGAALIFVTRGPLSALRGRVKALADRHNRALESDDPELALAAEATVQEIEHGAVLRFDFIGEEGMDEDERLSALVYAQQLAGPECPLLQDTGPDEEARRPPTTTEVPMPGATVPNVSPGVSTPIVGGVPPTISM